MTLRNSQTGGNYLINYIDMESNISRRLQSLGLTNGAVVNILTTKPNGSIILKVRGSRLAIGDEIARKISISSC